MFRRRPFQFTLRLRLTIWYTLSLGLILLLFTTFLYLQVRRGLIAQVDSALNLAANQALIDVTAVDGRLSFATSPQNPEAVRNLNDDFVIELITENGGAIERLNSDNEVPEFSEPVQGYSTQSSDGEPWRVYRQAVELAGVTGSIQAAQELDPVFTTLKNLQGQIFLGLPLALLLAGFGGYFLAQRALHPIDRITQTAKAITASDLAQRIFYKGPPDEVGRLAQTFDSMLDRLESAFARERRFTGDAAHELRTPLTALKGRIGVTLNKPRTTAVYQETLHDMEDQVDRLIRLSSDLLFMARLDQSQVKPNFELIDLEDFMGAVIDQIRPLAVHKQLDLSEEIPEHLKVRGDLDLLIRLFINLLDNAVKYTPPLGCISIKAQEKNREIVIAISDSGDGISAEHLPNLFDRFYRVEEDRSRAQNNNHQGGAGLGLAIAYEIARSHGGRLEVESQIDQGTTFYVFLAAS